MALLDKKNLIGTADMSNRLGTCGQDWLIGVSVGLFFSWQFCLLPPLGDSTIIKNYVGRDYLPALQMTILITNLFAGMVFVLLPRSLSCHARISHVCMGVSTLAQILAFLLLALVPVGLAKAMACALCVGLAVASGWVALILLLSRHDVEVTEHAFVLALVFSTPGFVLSRLASPQVCTIVLMGSSVLVYIFFTLSSLRTGAVDASEAIPESRGLTGGPEQDKPTTSSSIAAPDVRFGLDSLVIRTLGRCFVAYVCISISQSASADQSAWIAEWAWLLYTLGFFAAAAFFWVFVNKSASVDLNSSIRFVFPLLALGVVLGGCHQTVLVATGVLLLSACHASFELMTRAVVVSLMRLQPKQGYSIGTLGLVLIGLGSLLGVVLLAVIEAIWPEGVMAVSLAVVVLLLTLFFVTPQPLVVSRTHEKPMHSGEDVARCVSSDGSTMGVDTVEVERPGPHQALVSAYGLTPRESEVLRFLLEGRSHPFIRDELCISKGTVDTHVRHIYRKCGVSTKQELISLAQSMKTSSLGA